MAKEGRRVRSLDPMNYIIPYIMPTRSGASNMFKTTFDVTEAEKYLREKRLAGFENMNMLHVFIGAYVRVVSQMPGINRFIRGQKIYARSNIEISLAIKKKMTVDAQETVVQFYPKPTDTLEDIYREVNTIIEENRAEGDTNDMDSVARLFNYIPGLLLKFAIGFLRMLDYFGIMPKAIVKVSPFHGSMFITSMGSLGIDAIYHHLYNFGNIPVFVCMGRKQNQVIVDDDGNITQRKAMDMTVVSDERICDGFYYAQAFKMIKKFIEKPWLLETPPETVVEDVK